jgi:geranylgeranyl pyrophosphate synthase
MLGWRELAGEDAFHRALVDKTAYHAFAAPLAAGLRIASPAGDTEPAISWGCRMGVAFQGVDDLTDLVSSPEVTGKDGFKDILGGRLSLALFLLNQRTTNDGRDLLRSISGKGALDYTDRVELDRLVRAHDIVGGCVDYIRAEIEEARRITARSSYTIEAQDGMAAIEQGLHRHLEEIADSAPGSTVCP